MLLCRKHMDIHTVRRDSGLPVAGPPGGAGSSLHLLLCGFGFDSFGNADGWQDKGSLRWLPALCCFFQEGLGRVGVERGEAGQSLCGFRELLNWGCAKLLKAMSGIWAPGMCLLLTSWAQVVFHPSLLGFRLSLRFGVGSRSGDQTPRCLSAHHPPSKPA